ncbi:MAG: hypothetical protein ACOCQG_03895 [Candidatus Nanoarchaeia archaeon]
MVYNVLRRERPEPEGRASHRSVTDGGRGLLTAIFSYFQCLRSVLKSL